jgi:hypothetical protein
VKPGDREGRHYISALQKEGGQSITELSTFD